MKIINSANDAVLAESARAADSFFLRLKGLLGERSLLAGGGLIISPCTSVHTFFMRFPIDVIFVGRENKIIKTYSCLAPWRASAVFFNASYCIELPAGTVAKTLTREGDRITIETVSELIGKRFPS